MISTVARCAARATNATGHGKHAGSADERPKGDYRGRHRKEQAADRPLSAG